VSRPRGERRVAVWLAALATLAYLPFNHCHFSGTDELGVFEPAERLYREGDIAVEAGKHRFRGPDGRIYSHFAIGQSLLVLPFVAAGDALGRVLPGSLSGALFGRVQQQRTLDTLESPTIFGASLYAPLVTGLLVALFYVFERRLGASRRSALWAAGLLGGTTYLACHAVYFLRHTTEALAILAALFALHAWRRSGRLAALAAGSLCASLLVLIRVPAAVAGPALAGYLAFTLWERRRSERPPRWNGIALAVLLPALLVAAAHLIVNHGKWGTWIASPMLAQSPLLSGSLLSGLHGLLLSPGASIFVYSPLLLLLPWTLPGLLRSHRAETVALLAVSASFLGLAGSFLIWHGLWSSPGPRYLLVLTPLLMLPLGPWLDRQGQTWQPWAVAGLGLAGLAVQIPLLAAHWPDGAGRALPVRAAAQPGGRLLEVAAGWGPRRLPRLPVAGRSRSGSAAGTRAGRAPVVGRRFRAGLRRTAPRAARRRVRAGDAVTAGPRARRRFALASLGLALLVLALRAPLFALPLERDEGGYAYIAWRLAAGETPYLDWFDQKPPGIFAAYALALSVGGDPVVAIRALAAICCAASAIALFGLVRRLAGEAEGALAGALLALLSADGAVQGPIANTELFMLPWVLAAAWGTLRIPARAPIAMGASLAIGAALGIACAFKQVAAVNAPLLLAVFWLRTSGPGRWRRLLSFGLWLALGGLLVWAAIAAWLASQGALGAALDAVLLHNLAYTSQLPFAGRLELLAHHARPMLATQGAGWGLAVLGIVLLAWRRERLAGGMLVGLAAVSAVGVSASGLYFPHYFQQLLPALAALAAVAISGLSRAVPARLRTPALVAVAALVLVPPAQASFRLARLSPAQAIRQLYPGSVFETMPEIAAEIAAHTTADDRIFVFGAEPEILFYGRRLSASRYIYLFPLYGDFPDAEERQAGVIAEIERAQPAFIVWIPNRMFFAPGSSQHLTDWTTRYVDEHYRLHAIAAAEGESRGVVRRLPPGTDAKAFLAKARPWASIFRRVDAPP
jgi:4-amino-4-deoxy-L-arabinose transferase-like glycosyltransferase